MRLVLDRLLSRAGRRVLGMAWTAKPSGGYSLTSAGGRDNIEMIYYMLQGYSYTMEAAAGVMGNVQAESGMNPWRWQSDRVNLSGGYGLFQYTPASGYINLSGTTPNMSTTQTTAGATPQDGERQVDCYATNELHKWVSTAWRSYWDTTTYAELYNKRSQWLQQWGSGSAISMAQMAACTDIEAATFFHMACFEGPAVPNLGPRFSNAKKIYEILGGIIPVPPPPVPPPTPPGSGLKWWLIHGLRNARDRGIGYLTSQ